MHKESGYILCELEDVQTNLDDSLTNVNNILGSRYSKRLQVEVEALLHKLNLLSDTIEQWKECQKKWIYLENIFASPDIRRQRARDYQDFELVNRSWTTQMKKTYNKRLVFFYAQIQIYNEFMKNNQTMEKIEKNLEMYLEEKRTLFPRFYFLSNDELLQILASALEIRKVEKHLNKCFDNI
jgi:dynein heavy chain